MDKLLGFGDLQTLFEESRKRDGTSRARARSSAKQGEMMDAKITRYCFCSEGMSDPPERYESPTGDVVDYWDHLESEKQLLDRIAELESQLTTESKRTAEELLRANQMTEQHRMQCYMHKELETENLRLRDRKPLTPNEVSGLLESAGYWPGDITAADFINGLRHGEMAHGIGDRDDE